MAGIFLSALIRGALLGADVGTSGKPLNLVGDDGNGTGVPGICIAHFEAVEKGPGQGTDNITVRVNCDGEERLYLSAFKPTVNSGFTVFDDRIPSITVSFEAGPGGNTAIYAPFPGKMILTQDTYSVSANFQKSNAVPIGALVPKTGPNDMGAKNCNGDDVRVIVGVQTRDTDLDSSYAVAFPRLGQAIACSS